MSNLFCFWLGQKLHIWTRWELFSKFYQRLWKKFCGTNFWESISGPVDLEGRGVNTPRSFRFWINQSSGFPRRPQNLKQSPTWFDVYILNVKSSGILLQIFVAFSVYPNFKIEISNGRIWKLSLRITNWVICMWKKVVQRQKQFINTFWLSAWV